VLAEPSFHLNISSSFKVSRFSGKDEVILKKSIR